MNVNNTHNTSLERSALYVVKTLRSHGYEAYFVGGCVRNMLMNIPPGDIDVATSARPPAIIELFPHTVPVGAKFGVVIVIHEDIHIEVATFRSEQDYGDYRHPRSVTYATAEKDAGRRDFTINALFYDPLEKRVIDFVDGKKDIEKGIVRAVGDPEQRFTEDALRMLRGVRFAARFKFSIEHDTLAAIKNHANLIMHISADRIREECIKMFTAPHAGHALRLLDETTLLEKILPEVADMKGVQQPRAFHPEGDVFEHTVRAMNYLDNPSPSLAFAVLLHDVGKPKTFRKADRIRFDSHDKVGAEIADLICRRLNFSTRDRKRIVSLISRHMKFLNLDSMRESTLKKFLAGDTIEEDLELHRVDCLASHGDLSNYDYCVDKLEELQQEEEEILPPPLLNGNDLIAMGYTPGPLFGDILQAVTEEQLEGNLISEDEAREWVREQFPRDNSNE